MEAQPVIMEVQPVGMPLAMPMEERQPVVARVVSAAGHHIDPKDMASFSVFPGAKTLVMWKVRDFYRACKEIYEDRLYRRAVWYIVFLQYCLVGCSAVLNLEHPTDGAVKDLRSKIFVDVKYIVPRNKNKVMYLRADGSMRNGSAQHEQQRDNSSGSRMLRDGSIIMQNLGPSHHQTEVIHDNVGNDNVFLQTQLNEDFPKDSAGPEILENLKEADSADPANESGSTDAYTTGSGDHMAQLMAHLTGAHQARGPLPSGWAPQGSSPFSGHLGADLGYLVGEPDFTSFLPANLIPALPAPPKVDESKNFGNESGKPEAKKGEIGSESSGSEGDGGSSETVYSASEETATANLESSSSVDSASPASEVPAHRSDRRSTKTHTSTKPSKSPKSSKPASFFDEWILRAGGGGNLLPENDIQSTISQARRFNHFERLRQTGQGLQTSPADHYSTTRHLIRPASKHYNATASVWEHPDRLGGTSTMEDGHAGGNVVHTTGGQSSSPRMKSTDVTTSGATGIPAHTTNSTSQSLAPGRNPYPGGTTISSGLNAKTPPGSLPTSQRADSTGNPVIAAAGVHTLAEIISALWLRGSERSSSSSGDSENMSLASAAPPSTEISSESESTTLPTTTTVPDYNIRARSDGMVVELGENFPRSGALRSPRKRFCSSADGPRCYRSMNKGNEVSADELFSVIPDSVIRKSIEASFRRREAYAEQRKEYEKGGAQWDKALMTNTDGGGMRTAGHDKFDNISPNAALSSPTNPSVKRQMINRQMAVVDPALLSYTHEPPFWENNPEFYDNPYLPPEFVQKNKVSMDRIGLRRHPFDVLSTKNNQVWKLDPRYMYTADNLKALTDSVYGADANRKEREG